MNAEKPKWSERVWLKENMRKYVEPDSEGWDAYLSIEEHTHLLREARAEAFDEAILLALKMNDGGLTEYIAKLRAKEMREGGG